MYTDAAFFDMIDRWGETYAAIHESAMVLGADERHFGLNSWGGWIWPYRVHVAEGEPVNVRVTIRNPLNEPASIPWPKGRVGSTPAARTTNPPRVLRGRLSQTWRSRIVQVPSTNEAGLGRVDW